MLYFGDLRRGNTAMRTMTIRAAAAATAFVFATGCASTTIIRSQPPGAKVYIDGESVGQTPYVMSDQKIVGSSTHVKLVLDGYEPFNAVIQRNEQFEVGPCIGGVLVLFPFLWIMGYKPEHNYELLPAGRGMLAPQQQVPARAPAPPPRS